MENLSLVPAHKLNEAYTGSIEKRRTTLLGLAFIIATVTAIIGLKLYDPILLNENYLIIGISQKRQIAFGAISEMLLICANSFTAILMYPYLKLFSQRLGIAYICFRLLEVVFILIGIVSVLALLSVTQVYQHNSEASLESYKVVGTSLKAIHDWTFILGPYFSLAINTFIYSYVFFKSGLVPRQLSIWGISGAVFVFTAALMQILEMKQSVTLEAMVLAMPIATYEMVLAGWLITKGFNLKSVTNKLSADNSK